MIVSDPKSVAKLEEMASLCNSARCTKCGKKKRPIEDIISMRDSQSMDMEIVEALWSPLEPSTGRSAVQQAPSYTPSQDTKTIMLDVIAKEPELDDSFVGVRERKNTGQETMRNKVMSAERHISRTRMMHNFARGMASAFGTTMTTRPRTAGKKAYLNDFELSDGKSSRSFISRGFPSRSRIQYLFSRMGGTPAPLAPEQHPLAADYHENLSFFYPAYPTNFRVRII